MKKIAKLLGIFFFCLIVFTNCVNAADSFASVIKSSYINAKPFYQKMYSCTPYQYKDMNGMLYQVVGKNSNTCNVKLGSYNCAFPMDVNQKYASDTIKLYDRKIAEIEKTNNFSFSTSDPENKYFNAMNSKYCKIQF